MGLFSGGGGSTPAPQMPQAPTPQQQPQGQKPKRRSMQPTFLGENAMPAAGGFEGKTLIGQ